MAAYILSDYLGFDSGENGSLTSCLLLEKEGTGIRIAQMVSSNLKSPFELKIVQQNNRQSKCYAFPIEISLASKRTFQQRT